MNFPWNKHRDIRDDSLDEEIRAHLVMAISERIARGESPEEAAAAARREFGNVAHVKEVTRETWGGMWFERLAQDLRYAARSLARTPGFAAVAVLTLALGIGANTAMFTVMNGVLLRPLPFANPERLFVPAYGPPRGPFSSIDGLIDAHFLELVKNNPIFERVTTIGSASLTITGSGEPARLTAASVTPDFFPVFGVSPAIGRVVAATEGVRGRDNVVVLSDHLWRTRFGADPRILGSKITLDGTRRMIIGVMPASFDYPARTDLWMPLEVTTSAHEARTRAVVGRLKRGITPEQAAAAWASYAAHLELLPGSNRKELIASLLPLKQVVVGDARRPLLIFAGAVAFVLLIACANVANLLLMRVASRDRELAIRAAIGAGRSRLVRQLLTETFALSALGAVVGVALAAGGVRTLLALAPTEMIPRAGNVQLDATVLLFSIGLTVVTTAVCGLIPAFHATESRLRASLAEGARTLASSHGRLRATLVVTEVALAVVLLTGAGLMMRSFSRMRAVELGFQPTSVLTTTVDLPPNAYRSDNEMRDFQGRVLTDLARIRGVEVAAAVNWIPLGKGLIAGDFHVEGGEITRPGWADKIVVSPDYFRAMGVPMERGREFSPLDRIGAPGVVIVSRSVADKFWPRDDAVGKRITMSEPPSPNDWLTIVGVVNDIVQTGVTSKPDAAIYRPMLQTTFPFFLSHVTFVARVTGDTRMIAPEVRRVVSAADNGLPVPAVTSMADVVGGTVLTPRFQARVLLIFSVLALTLAVIGIYAVLAYGVSQRRREIGVRIALGAVPRQVMGIFLRRTMALVIPGLLMGVLSSLALTRVLAAFLFQVQPTDPMTFISVAILLAVVALAAASVPARRASRVDPLIALRSE